MAEPSGQRTRRWETLIGPANARDLGGYATVDGRVTRWGQLWRSDSLHCLDDAGVAELVRGGVRTVLDLRNTHEAREFPVRVGEHVRYVHMPLRFGEPILSLGSLYRSMVDDYGEDLRAILGQLAEPGALPALFHCAVGKDRTGVVSALLLGVAGVPHATIAEDYALSAGYLAGPFADALRRRSEANGGDAAWVDRALRSPVEEMLGLLAYLDERWGGPVSYLRAIGLPPAQIAHLRDELLDP